MKKKLTTKMFRDVQTETRIPFSLWKFFMLSVVLHVLFLFSLITMDISPDESDDTGISRVHQQDGRIASNKGGPIGQHVAFRGERTNPQTNLAVLDLTQPRNPSAQSRYTQMSRDDINRNTPNRSEPLIVDREEPAYIQPEPKKSVVYTHTIKNQHRDLNASGTQFVQLYQKPFLNTVKKPVAPLPVRTRNTKTYQRVKQSIERKQLPASQIVKIEELINFFHYDYPLPEGNDPFSVSTELGQCPWRESHLLLSVGMQGKIIESNQRLKDRDFVIARNVTMDITFDPSYVNAHRLIGYAQKRPVPGGNQGTAKSSDLRLGQRITTLYEIIPNDKEAHDKKNNVEKSEIKKSEVEKGEKGNNIAVIYVSFTDPDNLHAGVQKNSYNVMHPANETEGLTDDFIFSAIVAQFGMMLKNPDSKISVVGLIQMAQDVLSDDKYGFRADFIKVLNAYKQIKEKEKKGKHPKGEKQ